MRISLSVYGLIVVAAGSICSRSASAEDWPNFRGPRHDGISAETNLLTTWPAGGPKRLWEREVGAGFSSFAVVGDAVYTCGTEDEQQVIFRLNAASGEVVWKRAMEPKMTDPDPHLHGPRATPTVEGDRVYMLAAHAHLFCLDAKTGEIVWQREFKGKPNWGYSGSVLLDGDLAIVSPGGSDGALCALNKRTGDVVWKCGDDAAAYATPYPFTLGGRRYVCGFMAESVVVAEVSTGRPALRFEWPSHSGVNACTPLVHDGHLLVSTGYGYGAGLFKLEPAGDVASCDDGVAADSGRDDGAGPARATGADAGVALKATEVWKSRKLKNKFQTPVLIDGHLYTSDEHSLKCVEFMTGAVKWQKSGIKHGPMLGAGGHLLLLTETGELELAKASPKTWKPIAAAKLFEGNSFSLLHRLKRERQGARCWTAPVIANGRLYLRDHTRVVCMEIER